MPATSHCRQWERCGLAPGKFGCGPGALTGSKPQLSVRGNRDRRLLEGLQGGSAEMHVTPVTHLAPCQATRGAPEMLVPFRVWGKCLHFREQGTGLAGATCTLSAVCQSLTFLLARLRAQAPAANPTLATPPALPGAPHQ